MTSTSAMPEAPAYQPGAAETMATFLKHSYFLAVRDLHSLLRQPWYVALTVIQPILSLLLYGQVFERVAELPGLRTDSYLNYLTPGMVILTAFFAGGWHGMAILREMERGTLDRFLACPVSRQAIFFGRIAGLNMVVLFQSVLILFASFVMGGSFSGGVGGIAVLLSSTLLLSTTTSLLSNGIALLIGREESLVCASNFLLFPMVFLSSIFVSAALMPQWIRRFSSLNPVNWGVEASREALNGHLDVGFLFHRIAGLLVALLLCMSFTGYAFSRYRRNL